MKTTLKSNAYREEEEKKTHLWRENQKATKNRPEIQ